MRRSAAAYQKFTEDEIRQANSVDILSLLPVDMAMSRKRLAARPST